VTQVVQAVILRVNVHNVPQDSLKPILEMTNVDAPMTNSIIRANVTLPVQAPPSEKELFVYHVSKDVLVARTKQLAQSAQQATSSTQRVFVSVMRTDIIRKESA
jgi:hypothetical protein